MQRAGRARLAPILAFLALVPGLVVAGRVHAYAPVAAAAIAGRASSALPPAARWDSAWDAAAAAEVERLLEAEDSDPEVRAAGHRFVARTALPDAGAGDEAAGAAQVIGFAPLRLVSAVEGLRRALGVPDPHLIVRHLAELSIATADLADPFLMSSPELREIPGARARFSDLLGDRDLMGIASGPWTPPADAIEAALELAAQSADWRLAVEEAILAGDAPRWAAIRRERLGAALTLAKAALLAAWEGAGSRAIEVDAAGLRRIRVTPHPCVSEANLSFVLPQPEAARLELFDASGRRLWMNDLGTLSAGPRQVRLDPGPLAGLPRGIYFVRVSTPTHQAVGRLTYLPR